MYRIRSLGGLFPLALSLLLAACASSSSSTAAGSPSAEAAFPVTIDAANGSVTIESAPTKVVSISPTATEMLFAIGAGDQVVAADSYSNYPADAPTTDLSAYEPNVEAIASYDPDLVVYSDDLGDLQKSLDKLHIPARAAARRGDDRRCLCTDRAARSGHGAHLRGAGAGRRSPGGGRRGDRIGRRPGVRNDLLLRARRHVLLGHLGHVHRQPARPARHEEHRRRGQGGELRLPAAVGGVHRRGRPRSDPARGHEVLRPGRGERRGATGMGRPAGRASTMASSSSTTTSPRGGARGSCSCCRRSATPCRSRRRDETRVAAGERAACARARAALGGPRPASDRALDGRGFRGAVRVGADRAVRRRDQDPADRDPGLDGR